MRNGWMRAVWLAVAMTGMAGAGWGQAANAGAELGGTSWQLVKFEGGDGKVLTPDDSGKYTVAFAPDGGVSARIDCNRGRGTWKSSGGNDLEFGPLGLTRMMCPTAALNDRIARDWDSVRSYTLRDGHLLLSLADGGTYEFRPEGAAVASGGAAALEDTYWKLTRVGGMAVSAASETREPHLVFSSETHRVSGMGGCNRIMGSYEVHGNELKLSQMAGTMMACIDGMDTEQKFLNALRGVKTWKVTGNELDLADAGGTVVARFERKEK